MLALIVLLIAAVLVGVYIGRETGSKAPDEPEQKAEQSEKPKPETKAKAAPKTTPEVAVGQTAELSDRTLTVYEVERNFSPPGQFPSSPEPGNEFVRVNASLVNTSNASFSINPYDFELEDSSGVRRNEEIMTSIPNRIGSGSLAPGGTLTGNLVFEAPQGDGNIKLVYEPPGTRDESVTVNL